MGEGSVLRSLWGLRKKSGDVCDLVGVRVGGGGSVLFRGHSWV